MINTKSLLVLSPFILLFLIAVGSWIGYAVTSPSDAWANNGVSNQPRSQQNIIFFWTAVATSCVLVLTLAVATRSNNYSSSPLFNN